MKRFEWKRFIRSRSFGKAPLDEGAEADGAAPGKAPGAGAFCAAPHAAMESAAMAAREKCVRSW
jgi:hypothetical protein